MELAATPSAESGPSTALTGGDGGTRIVPWSPPGPVALAALQATSEFVFLQGPVGSGKTGTFIMKALAGVSMQVPRPIQPGLLGIDGLEGCRALRQARLYVLKTDYRRLWENFIPSWWEWVPKHAPRSGFEWIGSHGGPATQLITLRFPDGTAGRLDVHFMALGDLTSKEAIEDFFAGIQATWIWLNELQTFARLVYDYAFQRIGRYPRELDGGSVFPAVWADGNAPVMDTWVYNAIVNHEWIPGTSYFRQPGAREPGAENLKHLGADYYDRQIRFMARHEVERKVDNRFGRRLDGKPVHDFDDNVMVADAELAPDLGLPLIIGMDGGGSPAAVLMQRRADTQLRALDEIVCEHGVGPERFGRRLGALLDGSKYVHFRARPDAINARCDPSAEYGADAHEGERNWMQRVAAAAGIDIRAARTQEPVARRQAVDDCLVVDGTMPLCLISPTCKVLRGALNGGYRWRKMQIANLERYDEAPEKNDWSHVAEAFQYGALEEGGYERALGRERSSHNAVASLLQAWGYTSIGEAAHGVVARLPGRMRAAQQRQRPIIID